MTARPDVAGAPRLAKVVPKGLRSFSPEDQSFFLELMPGPRDRDGLPEIVRFWKTRIEATDRETAFAVGLIFGPSGCGKSSLVHAGILPKLEDSVLTVSVAAGASGHGTEAELLRRLRHRCPELAGDEELDLPEALRRLRQGQGLPAGKKLLIVLDQFEQYLQSCPALELAPLVEALRQCDGEHVQCLVLVRDDFWIALTRFLRMLEIDLSSDRNMTAVDLFDRRHARAVLAAFGRGHDALPEDPEALTHEQKKFLDQAIDGLVEGDRVICVRLALFAEMFKDRPWTPSSLKELGGIQGVGVAFLKATIGSEARHPVLSLHREAARAILESLLPPAGSPLKGRMRSYSELLAASGYHQREGEFRELLRVLDSELRLLTPAEEPDAAPPRPGRPPRPRPSRPSAVEGRIEGFLPVDPRLPGPLDPRLGGGNAEGNQAGRRPVSSGWAHHALVEPARAAQPAVVLRVADDPLAYPAAGVVARLAHDDGRGVPTAGHPAGGLSRGDGVSWSWEAGGCSRRSGGRRCSNSWKRSAPNEFPPCSTS